MTWIFEEFCHFTAHENGAIWGRLCAAQCVERLVGLVLDVYLYPKHVYRFNRLEITFGDILLELGLEALFCMEGITNSMKKFVEFNDYICMVLQGR